MEKKVKKLILVAPAILYGEEIPNFENLLRFQIDPTVKDRVGKIIIFVSDNDMEGIREAVKIFSRELGVKPIVFKGKGHFIEKAMGTREFPELLEKILE